MSNPVQTFVHERFGKIRVVIINGEPHFVGKDVAVALGYKDAFAALKQHVPDKFKRVIKANELEKIASQSKTGESPVLEFDSPRGLTFVNEAGLYKLILRSKLPAAEDFSDWVCGEVLPSIRKTGSYSLGNKQKPRKCHDIIAGYAFVYVFLLSNGLVKIGCSGNPRTRAAEIKRKTKLTIKRMYVSPFMPRRLAFFVEWFCQENFSDQRVKGEIFSVDFETACAEIKSFVTPEALQLLSKLNIATVNFAAAEKSK